MGISIDSIWNKAQRLSASERLALSRKLRDSVIESDVERQERTASEIDRFFGGWNEDPRTTEDCIELLRGNEKVRQKCVEHNMLCCISAVTAIELLYGAYNAPEKYREQELTKARMLIDYYTIVGIEEIPELFCSEKIRLEKAGNIIEDFDLMIGTTGVTGNLIVVTHNIKHFNRIEGLEYEDWAV